MKEDPGLIFAFNDSLPTYDHSIPISRSTIYNGYLAIGLANGNIRIYKLQDDQPSLTAHIESNVKSHVTALKGAFDFLFVAFADGTIAKYELSTGLLLNLNKLGLVATGLNCHLVLQGGLKNALLVWGQSTQVLVLDLDNLEMLIEIDSQFPNWPIASPLFSDHLLLVSRAGHSSQWRLKLDEISSKKAQETEIEELAELLAEPNRNEGHFPKFDLIIAVLLIGETSWVIVQRHGWTTFSWKNNRLVRNIGMCMLEPIVNAFHLTNNTFGLVQSDGKVVLVINDQMIHVSENHDGVLGAVHYYNKRIWTVVESDSQLSLAYAEFDPEKPVAEVEWAKDKINLETTFIRRQIITHITSLESGLITCRACGSEFSIFKGPTSWISNTANETYKIDDLKNDTLTALDIRSIQNGIIMAGTAKGKVLMLHIWNGQLDILSSSILFTSPVCKFLGVDAPAVSEISNLVVVSSLSGTVGVMDVTGAMSPVIIPGNHQKIEKVTFITSEKAPDPIITFSYEKFKKKSWNIVTMDEVQLPEDIAANGIDFHESPQTIDKTFAVFDGQPNTFSALMVKIDNIKGHRIRQALGKIIAENNVGIVSAYVKRSILSTTFIQDQTTIKTAASNYVACRLACALSFCGLAESFDKYIDSHVENLDIDVIADFVINHTRANSRIRTSSLSILARVIRKSFKEHAGDLENEIEAKWLDKLSPQSYDDTGMDTSMKALCVISEYINELYVTEGSTDIIAKFARPTITSLASYMSTDSPKRAANLAFELTGLFWNIWQRFCNPVTIVDLLLINLYQKGFSMLEKSQLSNFEESVSQNISVCITCAKDMARCNVTLMVSALIARVGDEVRSLDIRITAAKLLSALILMQDSELVIGANHLPLILSRVVPCLDHAEPAVREIPASANASLMTEATQLLSIMLNQYPNYMSFHRGQQRLAVAIIPGDSSRDYRGLLGVIYDLRTGALISSLGVNYITETNSTKIQGVLPGSTLHKLEFSEDGRRLAAVVETIESVVSQTRTTVVIAIWKISTGFFSMLQNINVRHGLSTHDTNYAENGAVLYPTTIIRAPIKAKDYFKFRWIASDKLSISGDQEAGTMTYSFD